MLIVLPASKLAMARRAFAPRTPRVGVLRVGSAERKRANNAAFKFFGMPQEFQTAVRDYKPRGTNVAERGDGSEKSVMKQVRAALRKHPNVVFCWREQSGKFGEGDRTINVGFPGKPDLIGMLRNGRFYAIECKNSKGGTRSAEQERALSLVRSGGGLAGFASSVEDAISIIGG